MQITGPHGEGPFEVQELWIEEASEIDAEYYASIILDRSEKKSLAMLSTMGGMNVEEIADKDPTPCSAAHRPRRGLHRRARERAGGSGGG